MEFREILQKFKKSPKFYLKVSIFLILGFFIFEFLVTPPDQPAVTIGLVPPQQLSIMQKLSRYLLASVSGSNIILISGANELDASRKVIADIYSKVSSQDGVYVTIPNGNYVRATFERELTNTNDITLYAKGTGTVEVYKKDSTEKIMSFDIAGENKYKQLLTAMSGTSDSFDLKSVGDISYDFITDPSSCTGTAPTDCSAFNADFSSCSLWGCDPISAGCSGSSSSCSSLGTSDCVTALNGGCSATCSTAGTNSCSALFTYSSNTQCASYNGVSTGCYDSCAGGGTDSCNSWSGCNSQAGGYGCTYAPTTCTGTPTCDNVTLSPGSGQSSSCSDFSSYGCSADCVADGTTDCHVLAQAYSGNISGNCEYFYGNPTGCTYVPSCSGTAAACSAYSNINNPSACAASGCNVVGGPPYPCSGTPTPCSGLSQSVCGTGGAGQGCTYGTEDCTGSITCGNFNGGICNAITLGTGTCKTDCTSNFSCSGWFSDNNGCGPGPFYSGCTYNYESCSGDFNCSSWKSINSGSSCSSSPIGGLCTDSCSGSGVNCSDSGFNGANLGNCPSTTNVCSASCSGNFDCPTYYGSTSNCSGDPLGACTYYGSDTCSGSVTRACTYWNSDESTCNSLGCTYSAPATVATITVDSATSITATGATITGNVTDTGGDNPTVYISYGTTDGGGSGSGLGWDHYSRPPTSPAQPQGVGAFSLTITGLSASTKYYFIVRAENSAGAVEGSASPNNYFTTSAGSAYINQEHFRIYNDDTSLNGVTALANEDMNYNVPLSTNFRIRFETANTGTAAATVTRSLEFKENSGAWTTITTSGNNVNLVNSTHFTDGDATGTTTGRLSSIGTFTPGQGKDTSSDTSSISLTNAYNTEDEYSLKFETGAQGNTYQFKITNAGTALDAYTVIPSIFAGPTYILDVKGELHVKGIFHVK